ncbi:MAG: pseudaminic acid synthase [Corynebacteriales bacterium]|nr:pseudaminic acid synthase [Mycobacteriales bacterium]
MSTKTIRIGHHEIGPEHKPFIIAEMSGNHNGDLERALRIVDIIADSGAQALKLQTYTADTITLDSDRDEFFVDKNHALWGNSNLYKLYQQAYTPWEWHKPIFDRAAERGLVAFSSAFDPTAVEFLNDLNVPAFKVASAEMVDLPLVRLMAQTGKPIVMSTGSATLTEIAAAVETAREAGCEQLVVLGCTASYPAEPSDSNLRQLPLLADLFECVVGYSDHTMGVGVSVAAVAMGASAIEKHVTTSRDDEGVDSAFSLNPDELTSLVVETERAWQALGEPRIGATGSEHEVRRLRRSLYVTRSVKAGETVSAENVRSVRPANGLPTIAMDQIDGWVFTRDVEFATPTEWSMFAPPSS